jgi:4-hydroxy-tetrahydrodipicolinate reductase
MPLPRGSTRTYSSSTIAAALVAEGRPKTGVRVGVPGVPLTPGEVHVVGVRAGHEPGTHTVGFDGEDDVVTLTHRARGRAGFALGAVLAAEWILGKRGVHGFDEVLADLVRGAKGTRW